MESPETVFDYQVKPPSNPGSRKNSLNIESCGVFDCLSYSYEKPVIPSPNNLAEFISTSIVVRNASRDEKLKTLRTQNKLLKKKLQMAYCCICLEILNRYSFNICTTDDCYNRWCDECTHLNIGYSTICSVCYLTCKCGKQRTELCQFNHLQCTDCKLTLKCMCGITQNNCDEECLETFGNFDINTLCKCNTGQCGTCNLANIFDNHTRCCSQCDELVCDVCDGDHVC